MPWQVLLNALAFASWAATTALLLADLSGGAEVSATTLLAAAASEAFCLVEVFQIAIGVLRGRLLLGVDIHATRVLILSAVLPRARASRAATLVLLAWTATELCRYPMILFAKAAPPRAAAALRRARFLAPLLTFPLGAAAEAWATHLVLPQLSGLALYAAFLVFPNNLLGGPAVYPGMVRKALAEFRPAREPKRKAEEGVQFPRNPEGRRSTADAAKRVWAAAAAPLDASLGARLAAERQWRARYAAHVLALAEASAASAGGAVRSAEAGLDALHAAFDFVRDGAASPLREAMAAPAARRRLHSARVCGAGGAPPAAGVPYEGRVLSGDALRAQLRCWREYGCVEPRGAEAMAAAADDAMADMRAHCVVCLGATSALGPLRALLRQGATVVAVARGSPAVWRGLMEEARRAAGSLLLPTRAPLPQAATIDDIAAAAGCDLLTDTPEIAAWLEETIRTLALPTTIGVYAYLDGEDHVRVSVACDAVVRQLCAARGLGRLSLAYIQTPSLPYLIPADAHAASRAAYARSPFRWLRLRANARAPVRGDGGALRYVHEGTIPLQGPNYALAKTAQLWRAVVARHEGLAVSVNIAPAARTASMVTPSATNPNAALVALGLDAMTRVPPCVVLDADTVAACMALLLVHDIKAPHAPAEPDGGFAMAHPWEVAAAQAFHGGTFRVGVAVQLVPYCGMLGALLFGPRKRPTPQ
ncbi:hypothetical protein AB1Y20_015124 [Prymnesium parvum]|uniref:very-long-chain (3R)-3-hydroxyacyl-CoA dehydratase n=1 Tax=Prymnesium parvum TaxID=97485 RepID=A0AB34JZU9_PRYPA